MNSKVPEKSVHLQSNTSISLERIQERSSEIAQQQIDKEKPRKRIEKIPSSTGPAPQLSVEQLMIVKAINTVNLEQVKELLKPNGSQIDLNFSINSEGLTPLMFACSKQDAGLVKLLIAESPTLNLNLGNKNGQTPLHLAANYKSLELVKILTDKALKPELRATLTKTLTNGTSPLHIAVKNNDMPLVRYFVEDLKADVNDSRERDESDDVKSSQQTRNSASIGNILESVRAVTCLQIAVAKGQWEMASYLLSQGALSTPEMAYESCKNGGDFKFVKAMMKKLKKKLGEADFQTKVVNGRFNKFKQTPLMKICFSGNIDLLKYLLVELKADTAITDEKDETCLFSGVKGNHSEIVPQLLQHNNDIAFVDHECQRNGQTAFARAVLSGLFNIADLLHTQGHANFEYVNKKDGVSILDMAKSLKNGEAVKYLQKLKLQSLKQEIEVKKQKIEDEKEQKHQIQQPKDLKELETGKKLLPKEEEKISPDTTNLKFLTPATPQLNRDPSIQSSIEPYTPIQAPNLVFVVEIAKAKPFYKRNDFLLETNDSSYLLTLTPSFFGQISHSCELSQIHDDELKLIRNPAIFEFVTHFADQESEQKEPEDQKDDKMLKQDVKTRQFQNVRAVFEKITMQKEDHSEWSQTSILDTKRKAVFCHIQMTVEQATESPKTRVEQQKHEDILTPEKKIVTIAKRESLLEHVKISDEFNEHQEDRKIDEHKLKVEPQQNAQQHPNNMLQVIPEEQYSPNSVSPSPQQQQMTSLIKPELMRQSTAHLHRQSLENLPLRQVSEPKRLQSNKQESSNGNTEQEFNQYQSDLVDIDHLIKSKDIHQNSEQLQDERIPTSNHHLNESESEPNIRPPRRQLSNQTNENGAIYSVPSSQEASSKGKQSLQKSPTKWSVDNSSKQEENRPGSSSSSFERSNDQGDNVVITQQRSSLIDSSEESSGFDRASKQNTSTIDKIAIQDEKDLTLQKQVIENLLAFEQRLTVLEKEGELHLTTNSDDESVQKELEQHRKVQILKDTISDISKQQISMTSSAQSNSINRTSSLAPSSMVGKQILVNMQKHTLMNLEKFDNRLRKLEKGMKESVSSSSDYSSDSSHQSSLSRSHSIMSHSQQTQMQQIPRDKNSQLQPSLQQKKSLTIPKPIEQSLKSETLVPDNKKIETIKLNKDNIKLQPQVTQKQTAQQKPVAKSRSGTKSRQSSNESIKNNSSPFLTNLIKTEKKSEVSKSPPQKSKVKILDTTPASDPIDVNNLTKKQQQAIPISTLMKLKRLEKMNKFKPQLDASALKKSTQSQKSKKNVRKSQDYSDDDEEDSPDDISRSTLKREEENERTRNQLQTEINLNNTQQTLEELMIQNLLQSRSNIEILSSLQDSMTAGTQNTGIAQGYPEGIMQQTLPIKILDEDGDILMDEQDKQKKQGDLQIEKELEQQARIGEFNKLKDRINSIEIKGMVELASDITKFLDSQTQPIEFSILDKNGNPQQVKLTVHQGVPGYFDKDGTFISLSNSQMLELAQGHKELELSLKSVINKNPGELATIMSKLSEIKKEIKQYQDENQDILNSIQSSGNALNKDIAREDINLRDSKGVLIVNKNRVVGQARTTQDQSPTNVDIRKSKELFGRQQSGAQLRKSLIRTSGQFRSQMKQIENNRDGAGTELGNYRNFLGGNQTSLDAYSTDAMTNFNHEQALKSASKLLKITSPDYYKAKLIKLRNKTPSTLQPLDPKPQQSVSVLDQIGQNNNRDELTKASIRQSLQFVSKIANIEIVKVKPPTLLMNQRFASPQVNISDQLLSKHHVEEPESMKDAAANIQLSLMKLKQIKEQYRGRYKYSRFSLGQ